LIEKIAELVREQEDRRCRRRFATSPIADGMRIRHELSAKAMSEVVLNQLYRFHAAAILVPRQTWVALSGGRRPVMTYRGTCECLSSVFRRGGDRRAPNSSEEKARDFGACHW